MWGHQSIAGWDEAGAGKNTERGVAAHADTPGTRPGSDLREVRDLGVRQVHEVEGAQLDAEASAPA